MSEQHFEVLIIGAGMVGTAVATALGSQGISVAIFDRSLPEPINKGDAPDLRVSALSHASEQILRHLEAWPHMSDMRMCPYRRMAVWEKLHHPWGKEVAARPNQTMFDAAEIGYEQLGFIVENRVTQLGLLAAMEKHSSIELICPTEITEMKLSTGEPSIQLSDGRRFTGNLLIGADGAQSRVRQEAGMGLIQSDYEQQCLVATVEIEGGCQDITWQAFTATGPEAFLPLPDINGKSYASIVWYNLPEHIRRLKSLSEQAFISELGSTFPVELPGIKKLINRASFPLARRHAKHYYHKGVVLVGDAAHTINPLAGQGVNLGFQDAAWLAEILVDAYQAKEPLGSATVLARYEKSRRSENQRMMDVTDGFYHAFSNDNKPLKVFRNIGLGVVGKFSPGVKQVMKYAMGMSGKQPRLSQGPLS